MKNSYETCMKLLRAESEEEVTSIIEESSEMMDSKNWVPVDGRDTNFNQIANQSSDGAKALTELMTNMVDAMLLKGCRESNIDPKSPQAPTSMYDAAQKFFNQPSGGLSQLTSSDPWVKDFNRQNNLVVAISGAKNKAAGKKPCFTFIDQGEGQEPQNFPSTFLSLSERNKRDIRFVQGKFNMGSSGVLGYCGNNWYKLIISRRYDNQSPWGWTLIRRRPVTKDELPISEYFIPEDKIPTFELSGDIQPLCNRDKQVFEDVSLRTGTIVKLYDYRTQIFTQQFKLREVFFENLGETVLPFKLLDCRVKPKKKAHPRPFGIDQRPFIGMEAHIVQNFDDTSESEDGDDVISGKLVESTKFANPDLGKIKVKALLVDDGKMPPVFKKSRNRFFHTVNGQVQFKSQQGLFSRMKLPYFTDRLIIIFDASELNFNVHNQVWKPDREGIRNTDEGDKYIEEVESYVKTSEVLSKLHQKLVQEEIGKAQSTGTTSFLQKLVKTDPTLAGMLNGTDPVIKNPEHIPGGDAGEGEFIGKTSPTFLRGEKNNREFNVSSKGTRLYFHTDAEETYFSRDNSPGELKIIPSPDNPYNSLSIGNSMTGGKLILYIKPAENTKAGEKFSFKVGLNDDGLPEPIMDTNENGDEMTVTLSIIDTVKQPHPKPPNPKPPKAQTSLSVPPHKLLVKDIESQHIEELKKNYDVEAWPEGFSEEDGGLIRGSGDETIYCINYDNRYHLDYRNKQKQRANKQVITMKFIMGMLISMIGYEKALKEFLENNEDATLPDNFETQFRKLAAEGAASTVLALSENLSKIIDIKTVENMDDQDD